METRYDKSCLSSIIFTDISTDGLIVDITITNPSGQCVCILSALEVAAHPMTVPMSPERSFTLIHQPLAMPPLSSLYVPGFLRSKIIEDFQSCQNTSLLEGYSDLVRLLLLHAIQVGKKVIYILDTGNSKFLNRQGLYMLNVVIQTKYYSTVYSPFSSITLKYRLSMS